MVVGSQCFFFLLSSVNPGAHGTVSRVNSREDAVHPPLSCTVSRVNSRDRAVNPGVPGTVPSRQALYPPPWRNRLYV